LSLDYSSLADVKQEHPIFLTDVSPTDKPWDEHKQQAETVVSMLQGIDDDYIQSIRHRMQLCAPWLVFAHTKPDERAKTFKLHKAEFCRVRACPICQWRRSMLYISKLMKAVPGILERYPSMRLIHLVLTVKNCHITELRDTIKEMNTAWKRLSQKKKFKKAVKGWVRSTEVSRNPETGEAHPHFHVMLFVPGYYFDSPEYYITHASWLEYWKDALRANYEPSIHIKAFRKNRGLENLVHEIAKYSTKPSDLTADADWLVAFLYQVRKLRFFATGGIVREVLGEIEKEYEDLIHTGNEETKDSEILAQSLFNWNIPINKYQHSKTVKNPNIPEIETPKKETSP